MDDWYVLYEVQWDSDLMGLAVFIYGSVLCVVYGVISNMLAVTVSQGTRRSGAFGVISCVLQ
jgi:hypothetical protein